MKNGKKLNNRKNKTTKAKKNQNAKRKGKVQLLDNTGSGHLQTSGIEQKNRKKKKKIGKIPQKNKKTTAAKLSLKE